MCVVFRGWVVVLVAFAVVLVAGCDGSGSAPPSPVDEADAVTSRGGGAPEASDEPEVEAGQAAEPESEGEPGEPAGEEVEPSGEAEGSKEKPVDPVGEEVAADSGGVCPEGMVYVEANYCTIIDDKCVKEGKYNRSTFYAICGAYARERRCIGAKRTVRTCIDKYEYPNKKGARPPSLIDAWDASWLCREQGKRLCWESEWTAACEGSKSWPFPYGYERDSTKCRQDIPPVRSTKRMWASDPKVQDAEMRRLDGSVPTGAMPECKSDFGVYDLTGNYDEWVFLERKRKPPFHAGDWAALKGGWWGQVRDACRPLLAGHDESFNNVSLSVRCCTDPSEEAMAAPVPEGWPKLWRPRKPHWESRRGSPGRRGKLNRGWSPDYPKYAIFNEVHAHIREEHMKEVHPDFVDPFYGRSPENKSDAGKEEVDGEGAK